MKRLIVTGWHGSGKATFRKNLNEQIGSTLFYPDTIWRKSDKAHISREEYDEYLDSIR